MPFSRTQTWQHSVAEIPGEHDLQTDIMRFLAILALCLMAVFALVQSLPVTAPAAGQVESSMQPMQHRLAQLSAAQQSAESTLQALRQARQTIQSELAEVNGRLAASQHELIENSARLASLERQLQIKASELELLNSRTQALSQRLPQSQRQILPPSPPAPTPQPAASALTPPATPAEPPVRTTAAEGFALRFASESALRSLVSRGRIDFIAKQEPGFWRLSLTGAQGHFKPAKAPAAYYEMTPGTVPASFRQALQRRTGQPPSARTAWGVTLPPSIAQRVQALMQTHAGGTLVIQADGEVRLEPGGHS
jgi:hypothetical protein